jgi:hypothetical protein
MSQRSPGKSGAAGRRAAALRRDAFGPTQSLYQLTRYLDSVVYFIRCPDGCIKIGYTTDLANRAYALAVDWTGILAVIPGGHEIEQELHAKFRPFRARSREYYEPAPELLDHVNALRVKMGVGPVAPWRRISLPPLVELDEQAVPLSE